MFGSDEKYDIKLVHVVIIVLLLLVLWKLHNSGERLKEGQYVGYGLDKYLYTSGATMRRLGQVFSQPAQGVQTTIYNAELRTDPMQKSTQGIPVVMFLDTGAPFTNTTNLYDEINSTGSVGSNVPGSPTGQSDNAPGASGV